MSPISINTMTIQITLHTAKSLLQNSSTPLLDAEILLSFVLQKDRSFLLSHPEKDLTEAELNQFNQLLEERKRGKPIAYLTHEKEFFGRSFFVDERVLIPRPETEEMVEDALEFLKKNPELKTVIDLGTGSGAIALTMALELPDHEIIGLEISEEALEVARMNHKQYPCKNLQLLQSDLFEKLPTTCYQLPTTILANLPYIGTDTNHFISEETEAYEPHLALFGGSDGLELYRRTWQQIKDRNLNIAALFMEIGFSQAEAITKEAKVVFPDYEFTIKNDLAGLPRTAIITKK